MQTQHSALGCRYDIYFIDCKLAIEFHENGHRDKNINYKKKIKSNRTRT